MSEENSMAYWWCLTHGRVEGEEGCAHAERLGPYDSEADAAKALESAAERTQEWDEQDKRDREWGAKE